MATSVKRSKLVRAHRRTSGFNALRRNIKKLGENMGDELSKVALMTGLRVKEGATRRLMTGEGRAPDPQTFELAKSVRLVVQKRMVRVGTAVMHGFYQEFGTRRHRASPWLYPSMRAEKAFYEQQLRQLQERAMRGIDPYEAD
jgi:hypothetical protein